MFSFGAWTFFISVNAYIYAHAQSLLIAALMPVAAVGYYALATGLSRQINEVLSPIGQVIYPAATRLHATNEIGTLERLYHDGSRLMLLAMICVVLVAWFWAEEFYRLWIGEKYLTGVPFPSVAVVLQILLIGTVSSYFSNIAGQVLMGVGRVRSVAILLVAGSVINLALSLVLIKPYGLVGLATATVIASVVIDLIAKPLVLQRVLHMRMRSFFRHACLRPAIVAILLAPLLWSVQRIAGPAENWYGLLLQGMAAGGCAVMVVAMFGVTAEERSRFLVQPIRDLLRGRWPDRSDQGVIR